MSTELLTAEEVGERLRVSGDTVRRWVRQKRLTAVVLPSNAMRFRKADIDRMLAPEPDLSGDAA